MPPEGLSNGSTLFQFSYRINWLARLPTTSLKGLGGKFACGKHLLLLVMYIVPYQAAERNVINAAIGTNMR
jgi:hypothetical protein